MKLGKQIRKIVMLCMIAVIVGCLGGCGTELSEKFDEDKVKEAAKAIVEKVNAGNLKEVYEDSFTPVMQNGVAFDELQESLDYVLEGKGEFQEYSKVEVKGTKDKDTGTEYAAAMVLAKYEDGQIMFTISFDTNMKCAGFYYK